MTNENQKKSSLKKYKFLVPQIVNLVFIGFVCIYADVGKNNGFIALFVMSSLFSIILSQILHHFYKIESCQKYAAKVKKEKNLPWNKRSGSYQIRTGLEDLSLILWVCVAFFIFGILRSIYFQKYANALSLLLLGSFVFVSAKIIGKILRKFFSKK